MRTRTHLLTTGVALLATFGAGALVTPAAGASIPDRPEQLVYPPLRFDPPRAADYRHEIGDVVVYLAPTHEFPLVQLTMTFRGGSYLDPPHRTGLAQATGAMLRRGGTTSLIPKVLDDRFDDLAALAATGAGDTTSFASLNALSSNFDRAFALFMDMLRTPAFDEARFATYQAEVIERLRQRNDTIGAVLGREWDGLMYGADSYLGRQPVLDDVQGMTIEDLRSMHATIFHPGNLVIAVSGDFEPDAMLATLRAALADWAPGPPVADPPDVPHDVEPGVRAVEKDFPQAGVSIGMRGIRRDDPDRLAIMVMNQILGGNGFSSRIMQRVRSDEGLTYGAGSSMSAPVWHDGEFRVGFQSRNENVALAATIILEEIERMRTTLVGDDELSLAKDSFIETFPRAFESRDAMLGIFVDDEITGRAPDYWSTYRDRIRAVTAEDVRRVARAHLHPDRMAMLVVGRWAMIEAGDADGRASMKDLFGGRVEHLPLRDPLTLK